MFRHLCTRSFAVATLTLLAVHASAQSNPDHLAGFAPMFPPTAGSPSAAPVQLHGGSPPLLGQLSSLDIYAPGYDYAVLLLSGQANTGLTLPAGPGTIELYVDPLGLGGVFPLPLFGGQNQFPLPIPPVPALVGLDLAFQAVVASGNGNVGASNLLLANLGDDPIAGGMQFAITFKKTIPANDYLRAGTDKMSIYCNQGGREMQVTITGTKTAGVGPLEIRDASGHVLATVPAAADIISVTVRVNPNECIYLFNADRNNGMTVEWEVAAATR